MNINNEMFKKNIFKENFKEKFLVK